MNIKIDILESNDESYDKSILELYEKRNMSKNSLNKRSIEDINSNSKEENFTKTVNILNREKESNNTENDLELKPKSTDLCSDNLETKSTEENDEDFLKSIESEDISKIEENFNIISNVYISADNLNYLEKDIAKASFPNGPYVGRLQIIERMVEETYHNNEKLKNNIAEEICYFLQVSSHWRKIGGDGNCFYRSIMFRYMEYLVLESKIIELKEIANSIFTWFSDENLNSEKFNFMRYEIKQCYKGIKKLLSFTVIYQIIELIEKKNIKQAYFVLMYFFNEYKNFDLAMVMYFRFKLYLYLESNKDKQFSKDFPVVLGNLLPSQFETDDGKFRYESYYNEELLKLYTYAEKIVIFLTPYVLECKLKLFMYDYGKECNIQSKEFNYIPNKSSLLKNSSPFTLEVLYRKCHYDAIYNTEFINQISSIVNKSELVREKYKVVSESLLNYYQNNAIHFLDPKQSKIFDKVNKLHTKYIPNINDISNTVNSTEVNMTSNQNSGTNSNLDSNSNTNNTVGNVDVKKIEAENNLTKENLKNSQKNNEKNSELLESEKIMREIEYLKELKKKYTCLNCSEDINKDISIHFQLCNICIGKLYKEVIYPNNSSKSIVSLLNSKSNPINGETIKMLGNYFCSSCVRKMDKPLKIDKINEYDNGNISCSCNVCNKLCLEEYFNYFIPKLTDDLVLQMNLIVIKKIKLGENLKIDDQKNERKLALTCKCFGKISIVQLLKLALENKDQSRKFLANLQSKLYAIFSNKCMFCMKSSHDTTGNLKVDNLLTSISSDKIIDHYRCTECKSIPLNIMKCTWCDEFHK